MPSKTTKIIVNGKNENSWICSCILGKIKPTSRFPVQFTKVAIATAADRGAEIKFGRKCTFKMILILINLYFIYLGI